MDQCEQPRETLSGDSFKTKLGVADITDRGAKIRHTVANFNGD